ncbi:DHA2 family efflux MFS transporter permease subunit [Clostridium sp. 1001275B_160808_H3]|uniref:DHA2 family efflux MFS transporter permease subunit n=1 Tax=Clostridium sp. 1001275B_160808_H3 TaxID=2787110 RepID=UPI00189A5129|nr:DHA2 family efflux MFS transporter permease subunit [Clostridium sp. 1001275B_160808_H3]
MKERDSKEKSINKDIYGKEYNKTLLIIAIMIGSFVTILNQTLLSTALPQIMKYFKINASTAQWLTTAFMLVNAIMIPLTALLLEKISTRKLFMFSMAMFGIGTVICAISPNFTILLIGRIVQAAGAGIISPLANTALLMVFPPEKRGSAMGMYGLVICFAPAIGPTLSGIIIDMWNWHYLFYILIPLVALDIIFTAFFMKDVIPLKNPKIDFISILLSTFGFGLVLYGFSNAGNKGWGDITVLTTIIVGIIISASFIWRQLAMEHPMLEMRVFKSTTFTLTTVIGSILNIASVGASIVLPIFLQNILGKSAFTSGLTLLPGALLMAVTMLISGRLFDKYGVKKLAIPGIVLLIIASFPFARLHRDTHVIIIAMLYTIRCIGIALVIMPMQTAGVNDLSNKLLAHASAVVNMAKQVAGSLGTAVLITIMSNVTTSNAPDNALATTNVALYKSEMLDASLKGANTTFIFVIAITVISLIMSLFIKNKKKSRTLTKKGNIDQELTVEF